MLDMSGVFTEEEIDDIYDYCKEKDIQLHSLLRSVLLDAIAA